MFRKIFVIIASIFAFLSFFSCGSSSKIEKSVSSSTYYENNIKDFAEVELKNGIPVIFKKNIGSQVTVLRFVIEGGVPFIPYEKSGLEKNTLELMLHGSQKYSYQKIQRMEYEMSFSMSSNANKDYSLLGFTCIKRDFNDVLDVFADGILNPNFSERDFDNQMKLEESELKSKMSNPDGKIGYVLAENVFKNHPYATTNSVNEKSVKNISLDDIKKHHKKLLNANRIKIVVVGSLSESEEKEILTKLDNYFSSISKKEYVCPEIPVIKLDTKKTISVCESAGNIGYIEGLYPCPQRDSDEYIPYVLASMFIDDSLFRIVREKNSAVYSIGTGVYGARKLVGAISLYKVSKTNGLKDWIFESINDFPKTEKDVKNRLDFYKNKYITSIFENSQNASGISSNIVASLIYRNSATEYLNRTTQVQSVTEQQVIDAYKKYFQPLTKNQIKWFVISGKDTVNKFEL